MGFVSHYFITNPNRFEAVIENPAIVLINKKITLVPEIGPLLEAVTKKTKDVVIIAQDISGEALQTMVLNKMNGNINTLASKVPSGGSPRGDDEIDDLAIFTGGKVLNSFKRYTRRP